MNCNYGPEYSKRLVDFIWDDPTLMPTNQLDWTWYRLMDV